MMTFDETFQSAKTSLEDLESQTGKIFKYQVRDFAKLYGERACLSKKI